MSNLFKSYLNLMHELAIRTELVQQALQGQLGMAPAYAYEYSYFQFRKICELIALGCLQLNGDLPELKSIHREWNADKVMSALHKYHLRAFPEPATIDSTNIINEVDLAHKKKALSYVEFKKLYAKCNDILHRGSLNSFSSNGAIRRKDIDDVAIWCNKIVNLLNNHVVRRADRKEYYFIQMKNKNGKPRGIAYARNPTPSAGRR